MDGIWAFYVSSKHMKDIGGYANSSLLFLVVKCMKIL